MNASTNIAELVVHYADDADRLNHEVTRTLKKVFATILSYSLGIDAPAPAERIPDDPEEVADGLAHILFRSSRAAAAGAPNAKAIEGIRTRLLEFVQRRVPLDVQMLWSPRKHWQGANE